MTADRPRDLNHLVEAHRIAMERRAARLPMWRWGVRIKHLLSGGDSDEIAQNIAPKIAARLRRALPGLVDVESEEFDDDLDSICYDLDDVKTVNDLNDALERLYDWADINRLWLG